ncbi:sepiapterin reductase [Aureococcus anophagefferens]|uniref:Sepiapterin reductase n=1 Tax=Aureococcus anophagefferens TaxID=44056 RepID=A0ABR1FJR3_AURAN
MERHARSCSRSASLEIASWDPAPCAMARGETREARAQREAEEDAKDAEADRIMELAGKRLEQERHCLKKRDELMLFVSAGEIERVAFVLSGKKKPDTRAAADNVDYVGHTPLMLAALHDRVECGYRCAVAAPRWTRRGAATGAALHMACRRHGHAKMTKLLVDAGARVDLTDFRALTARDLACQYHHDACVDIIDDRPTSCRTPTTTTLYNLIPERAVELMSPTRGVAPFFLGNIDARRPEDELNHWLLEAKLHCGEDKIPSSRIADRSRFRSRHALANADPEDLRPLGIRGDDVDRVKTKAVQELPDLEDEELDEMQRSRSCRASAPWSRVLHVSSGAAHGGAEGLAAYCASKAALKSRALVAELPAAHAMRPYFEGLRAEKAPAGGAGRRRRRLASTRPNAAAFFAWLLFDCPADEFVSKDWDIQDAAHHARWAS